jgi:adenine deaminase
MRDDDAGRAAWIHALPKTEMHLHFEGAFRWSTIRELHPWGASLPSTPPWLVKSRPFPDFDDFRRVFRDYVWPVTGTEETLERHAFEIVEDLAWQNVRYAEIIVSHDMHTRRGLGHAGVWRAIVAGRDRAAARYPVDVRLMLGLNRHHGATEASAVFDAVLAGIGAHGGLDGIDLQGDERLGDVGAFADVFRRAADSGLKLRAHAGELAGAESVRATVFDHGVRQISHGVRAIEDAALVAKLARHGVFLHVCPTSNVLLECAASHREHPLRALHDAGVRCTLSSDDPLVFGSDVENEYRVLIREMGFSPRDAAELAKNGFRASLLPASEIAARCDEIDLITRQGAQA